MTLYCKEFAPQVPGTVFLSMNPTLSIVYPLLRLNLVFPQDLLTVALLSSTTLDISSARSHLQ